MMIRAGPTRTKGKNWQYWITWQKRYQRGYWHTRISWIGWTNSYKVVQGISMPNINYQYCYRAQLVFQVYQDDQECPDKK
jgi:hypothetical protein